MSPHLFIAAGPGHGRGGMLQGAKEMRHFVAPACLLAAEALADRFGGLPYVPVRISADEHHTLCILERAEGADDVEALRWWTSVVERAEGL